LRYSGRIVPVGPIVVVTVYPPDDIAQACLDDGLEIPFIEASLLVDTGAKQAFYVAEDLLSQLVVPFRMIPSATINLYGITKGNPPRRSAYDLTVSIFGNENTENIESYVSRSDVVSISRPPVPEYDGFIGRNLLDLGEIFYDGPGDYFSLEIPTPG
jgi:hypothetical protein